MKVSFKSKGERLEMQLSGRMLAPHPKCYGFDLQHL
jgi:hypothetical protein